MQTFAHLGQFARCKVNALLLRLGALLLCFHALLLAVRALAKFHELLRDLLNGASEISQLAGDARYVVSGCDAFEFYPR